MLARTGRNRNAHTRRAGMQTAHVIAWQLVWQIFFFFKLSIHLPYDPAILLPEIYLNETKMCVHAESYTPVFIAALFTMTLNGTDPEFPFVGGEWPPRARCVRTADQGSGTTRNNLSIKTSPTNKPNDHAEWTSESIRCGRIDPKSQRTQTRPQGQTGGATWTAGAGERRLW